MIVQKREGGFLYASTDLAAVRHRTETEGASRIIYCTDDGQAPHFAQVFQIAAKAGWGQNASLEHVPFGVVCGADGQKLKTRSGETTKLKDLLDTAVILAHSLMLRMYKEELEKVNEKEADKRDLVRLGWLEERLGPYLAHGSPAVQVCETELHKVDEYLKNTDQAAAALKLWNEERKAWLEHFVAAAPTMPRLDAIILALESMQSEQEEGTEQWHAKRDVLKAFLYGGDQDPWLRDEAAPAVGLGSVKFADLSMTRTNSYRFSYKKMVDFQGKSAPYMLYQFVRIKSIATKHGGDALITLPDGGLQLTTPTDFILIKPEEQALALHALDFARVLNGVEASLLPHHICDYLFDMSKLFSQFYNNVNVGKTEAPELKNSRLALLVVIVNTLKVGLDLIGLKTLDVM